MTSDDPDRHVSANSGNGPPSITAKLPYGFRTAALFHLIRRNLMIRLGGAAVLPLTAHHYVEISPG